MPVSVDSKGIERVLLPNWKDYYCGFHIHELRFYYLEDYPYKDLTTGGTLYEWTTPFDFMFKILKYECKHTNNANVDQKYFFQWYIKRSRELPFSGSNIQVWQYVVGGDTGPASDLLWKGDEQYIYPPTNLRFGWRSEYDASRAFPTLTIQVTY